MPATTDKKTNTNDRNQFFGEAAELARTPLLAAIGAGDLAARAVVESLTKLREQVNERTEAARTDLPRDFGQLRERLDPAELRKRVDSYAESARQLIDYLAGRQKPCSACRASRRSRRCGSRSRAPRTGWRRPSPTPAT